MAKSRLTLKEGKALTHYANKHGLVPQLSVFPNVRFKSRETGEFSEVNMIYITKEYESDTEESKREAAAEKKRQERADRWKPTTVK